MIVLLSPAKTLNTSESVPNGLSKPSFSNETMELVDILKEKSPQQLGKLMKISEKLSELNFERYQEFSNRFTAKNSKAAIHYFKGDVYLGLDADTLNEKELAFANEHVRILSGLYGLLKPLDKMQAYRLEMGTSLKNQKGKNLYSFWGDKLNTSLNKELKKLKNKLIVNLASKEYFSAIDPKNLNAEVVDISFKEFRNGKLSFVSFNAKRARGLMTRYIIKNNISSKADLKGFNYDNYAFDEANSNEAQLQFIR